MKTALVVVVCQLLPLGALAEAQVQRERSPKVMHVFVTQMDSVVVGGRHSMSQEEFARRLVKVCREYKSRYGNIAGLVVELSGDDAATYGALRAVIATCQKNHLERFRFRATREFAFELPSEKQLAAAKERVLPPFEVHLTAGVDGTLAKIRLDKSVVESLFELNQEIVSRLGDERGPDSISAAAGVEMRADDDLRLKHLAEAYDAVSGYKAPTGRWVPLIGKISPVPMPQIEVEEAPLDEEASPLE